MKGDPRSFTPAMAVDLLPVMATTFIVSMMKGAVHASEAALNVCIGRALAFSFRFPQGFTAVFHIMLLLLGTH